MFIRAIEQQAFLLQLVISLYSKQQNHKKKAYDKLLRLVTIDYKNKEYLVLLTHYRSQVLA